MFSLPVCLPVCLPPPLSVYFYSVVCLPPSSFYLLLQCYPVKKISYGKMRSGNQDCVCEREREREKREREREREKGAELSALIV